MWDAVTEGGAKKKVPVNTYNIKEALTGVDGVQQLINMVLMDKRGFHYKRKHKKKTWCIL